MAAMGRGAQLRRSRASLQTAVRSAAGAVRTAHRRADAFVGHPTPQGVRAVVAWRGYAGHTRCSAHALPGDRRPLAPALSLLMIALVGRSPSASPCPVLPA
jgi:hypothetical protein